VSEYLIISDDECKVVGPLPLVMTNTTQQRHEAWIREQVSEGGTVHSVEAIPFSEALLGTPDQSTNTCGEIRFGEEPGTLEKMARLRNARIEQHAAVRAARQGEGAMSWADIAPELGYTSHEGRTVKKFHDSEPPEAMSV
jgi:hypothetical protein